MASTLEQWIAAYEGGIDEVRAMAEGLSAEELNRAVAPGKWSVQQVIVHLLDSDLAATHRLRRMAAEDVPLLIAYDETRFVERLGYEKANIQEVVALFAANRRFTAQWLRTLPAEAFDRTGVHNQRGKVTLAEMVSIYVDHVEHHKAFVEGKRKAMGKPM